MDGYGCVHHKKEGGYGKIFSRRDFVRAGLGMVASCPWVRVFASTPGMAELKQKLKSLRARGPYANICIKEKVGVTGSSMLAGEVYAAF
jgi:hypothetical protein